MRDWKETLNLPRTAFPMKANLAVTEPQMLARWDELRVWERLRERAKTANRRFVLHDGPPYANGTIHTGHLLNKVLKDFVVKSRTMAGYDAPYVPGWDCHGLPIELNVDRELGPRKREMSVADFRRACRRYAERFIDIQRQGFKRLLVFGTWDDPYRTMSHDYQATIVRALGQFVERGLVYKGKKPVHWCIHCRTALAEAEVEYGPHASPSIYVEFQLDPASAELLARRVPALRGRQVSVLIWTTTPWTIPANRAIAFHPELEYGAYEVEGRAVIVAEQLAASVSAKIGRPLTSPVAKFKGSALDMSGDERISFTHPLYQRPSYAVLADYVTLDQGTGAVHTAPGHGSDDFYTGVRYGIEVDVPVTGSGHFVPELPLFGGMRVFDANPRIEEALKERGRLWYREAFEHSYPHCWRCHNPVIFLATWQWFIRLDADESGAAETSLRARALAETERVGWIPEWGGDRMRATVGGRPDWCISRQRSWGVPIPAVSCTSCGEALITTALVAKTAAVFEQHGADAWYERPLEEFLPEGLVCRCGSTAFERERDILDVWFDSGSSHLVVLARRPGHDWPADLYLEGSDQYRGWFQSSLLVGLGTRGAAPFRRVLTHGFVVDEQGRKMSKSLGNFVEPADLIKKSGADVLRLWVSMVDYRDDTRLGNEVLARVVEAYRKVRNTFRYLVSNLYDFDPSAHAVPFDRMQEVDRYALSRYADAAAKMLRAYEEYDYPTIFHTLNALVTVDLSAFYLDVSKDRLYTFGAGSLERRSAQTALYRIADGLARLIAPILPVTCEELWQHLPGTREESVHLALFPSDLEAMQHPELAATWQRLIQVRDQVNVALEGGRQEKTIGNSLGARVRVRAGGSTGRLLAERRADLPMLFIVSEVEVAHSSSDDIEVQVEKATGTKCPRCWRVVPALVPAADGEICGRCAEAVAQTVA
ncbi:MAG TPA: isoleucine--tRNA ligase [Vicinamibacterales bacterium]|nr:isoleucine--tRNA ligase [Vicinamibacterales bacterium]